MDKMFYGFSPNAWRSQEHTQRSGALGVVIICSSTAEYLNSFYDGIKALFSSICRCEILTTAPFLPSLS